MRRRRRADYMGCSLSSHHRKLRLEWRRRLPDGTTQRQTWPTGDLDTRANRARWEPARNAVAGILEHGVDPLPYLREHEPRSADAPATRESAADRGVTGRTVRDFYDEWIRACEDQVRPALHNDRRRHLEGYVLPILGARVLADLRPMDVQLLQAELRKRVSVRTGRPLSEKTVLGVVGSSFRAMIRDARVQEELTRDPFVGVTWKPWKIPPADPFTAEERDRILEWFGGRSFHRLGHWRQHPAFHAYVFFLFWHGARPSEASALCWREHIDLHKGMAHVEQSYHYRKVCDPKTRAARRPIELHPTMRELLRALRPLKPEFNAPVFPNLDGHRITPRVFWDTWKDCLAALRLRHRGLYAMKDTFVTLTLGRAEETGDVGQLTAWLVRQTGVRLDTLRQHYERWWPRDPEAVRATYAILDPSVKGPKLSPNPVTIGKNPRQTANRKWTMSPSCTT